MCWPEKDLKISKSKVSNKYRSNYNTKHLGEVTDKNVDANWGLCVKCANADTNTNTNTNTCVVRRSTVETTHMGEVSEAAGRRM